MTCTGQACRLLLIGALAAAPAGCADGFFAPPARQPAALAFALHGVTAGGAGEAFDKADAVSIRLLHEEQVLKDTVVALQPGAAEHSIVLELPEAPDGAQATAQLELRRGSDALFRWEGTVQLRRGATMDAVAQLEPVAVAVAASVDSVGTLTAIGDSVQLTAAALFATGDTIPGTSLAWSSADAAVQVSGGIVVAGDNGDARVVVRAGTLADTVLVRVRQAVARVEPVAADSVFTGFEGSWRAVDRRGNLMRLPVTWASSNPAAGDVAPDGRVLGRTAGTTTITVSAAGSSAERVVRVAATPLPGIQAAEAATCGLVTDGTAQCWGRNERGQLGNATAPWIGRPTAAVAAAGMVFEQLAASPASVCGLTAAGAAWCWGENTFGQLGDGTVATQWPFAVQEPRAVAGGLTFRRIAGGGSFPQQPAHFCALTADGQAYCWGANDAGQLGTGSTAASAAPVPVAGGLRFREIAAGDRFTCAVAEDARAYCWGANGNGQLGMGNTTSSTVPVAVSGGHSFARIDAGNTHACAITTTHALLCWGSNLSAQLGIGVFGGERTTPAAVNSQVRFLTVSAGGTHTCGTSTDNEGWCWGDNHTGRVGSGQQVNVSSPVRVAGGARFRWVSAGGAHSCGVDTSGVAYCWGDKGHGELGTGVRGYEPLPVAVAGTRTFSGISMGSSAACAVDTAGAGWCWGLNHVGQLGNGTFSRGGFATPTAVQGGHTFRSIATGQYFACGLATDGRALCWGDNANGRLGRGATPGTTTIPAAVSGTLAFTAISAGRAHACALTAAGQAYCWGANESGQLGDGSATSRNTPTAVTGGVSFASISAGSHHTCGVTATGAAYCWGSNASGALGNGSTTSSAVPVEVSGGQAFTQVEASRETFRTDQSFTCGITTSGQLLCWGANDGCKLANNNCDIVIRTTPVTSASSASFRALTVGSNGACAIDVAAGLHCWGGNLHGELGYGHANELIGSTHVDPGTGVPHPAASGLQVATASLAGSQACLLTTAGRAYCWGRYDWGALGEGSTQWLLTPAPVTTTARFR